MIEKRLFLSSSGFKNVNTTADDYDFIFTVNDEDYKCSKFFADFISPIISNIHLTDSSFDTFRISIPFEGSFSDILKISRGEMLEVNDHNYQFIKSVSKSLGNKELIEFFSENPQELSKDNVFEILTAKIKENRNYEKEISYIASHFYEIDEIKLNMLEYNEIYLVLSSSNLRASSEDALFDFVLNKCNDIKKDEKNELKPNFYFSLFENIEFCFLSNDKVQTFLNELDLNDMLAEMNRGVWRSVSKRLLLTKEDLIHRVYCKKAVTIKYNENDPINGVFAYLRDKHKTDIAKSHIINVLPSSTNTKDPDEIVDSTKPVVFQTDDHSNSWIAFDFNQMRMKVSSYTLQSYYMGKVNFSNPKSWILEGSDDGKNWVIIDQHENNGDLNDKNVTRNYSVESSTEFRLIRIRQTGKNWAGRDQLTLSKVEFFGELFIK